MQGWEYALWGAAGGTLVECMTLYAAIHRVRGYPWRKRGNPRLGPYLLAVVIRLGAGAILAAAAGDAGQLPTEFHALAVGVAAPLIVEKLTASIPVEIPEPPPRPQRRSADEVEAADGWR